MLLTSLNFESLISTDPVNEVLNTSLKSPDLQTNLHSFVGAHDRVATLSPTWKRIKHCKDYFIKKKIEEDLGQKATGSKPSASEDFSLRNLC